MKNSPRPEAGNGTSNRDAAVKYASEWFDKRNVEFIDYTDSGGNCNNFISQNLIAGGINQDTTGENAWYYYDDPSYSWLLVDFFYNYTANNTDGGFKAKVDNNYYSGQKGDIIQYGRNDDWKHSVIITDVIKDKDGNTIDYLVSSNSLDNKNFPASAYDYPQVRLIKILGK